ncbi:CLUMA_CG005834, isoform A [Clunio marinus]|uniref:CLUMA_CG005834, isoform A n=1 Tax=Clunio marinus TaxID=568069 RepID=A0A1J1HW10_9DIPT|nr:CLUMA_CG005834, isoform A [Clunio marinus]
MFYVIFERKKSALQKESKKQQETNSKNDKFPEARFATHFDGWNLEPQAYIPLQQALSSQANWVVKILLLTQQS